MDAYDGNYMKLNRILAPLFMASLLLLSSCSSRPVLYPNSKFKTVGKKRAKHDVNKCINSAGQFLESPKGKKILKSAGKGSILGAATGAIFGLFTGDIIRSLTTGAAMGATAGGVGAAISPDQLKRSYVNKCLQKQKYEIVGWD